MTCASVRQYCCDHVSSRVSQGFSPNLHDYGFRAHADAIAAIARHTNSPQLILGGHDWGGATVYRVAQWYPELIAAVFSIATPYSSTSKTFISTEALAKGKLPNFGYQLQLGSEDGVMERVIGDDRELVAKFLRGMYGGRTSSRRKFMTPENGINLDVMKDDEVGKTPFFDDEVCFLYSVSKISTTCHLTNIPFHRKWTSTQPLSTPTTSLGP
jgi:soluble epoxide hydrolase/lipid-phosphate phosphatase